MRLHHVGLAVTGVATAVELYVDSLGAELVRAGVSDEGLDFALLRTGDTELELLHSDDEQSAVGKFLRQRGPGVHHLAFETADLDREIERLRAGGYEIVGDVRQGIHGTRIVFLHPRSLGGVLTELVEAERGG